MLPIYAYLSLVVLSMLSIAAYFKLRISYDQTTKNPVFLTFQQRYVPIYLLAVLGDWLQGPYLYRLYHSYGYVERQVVVIYISGLVSAAMVSPVRDLFANRYGRKRAAIMLSLLYALSCLFNMFGNYGLLIIGRCLAGIASSLLFSTLDSWYIYQHSQVFDFPKEWIPVTFSHIAFGSSVMAVVAGLLADLLVRWAGLSFVSPFIISIPVLISVAGLVLGLWEESKKAELVDVSSEKIKKECSSGLKEILVNPLVFLVGTIQSLFESTLFVFMFIWTPAIGGRLLSDTVRIQLSDMPLGVAFASFMVCSVLGGLICDHLTNRLSLPYSSILPTTCVVSAIFFALVALFDWSIHEPHHSWALVCLQLFQLACGFYYPVMRRLRETTLPDENKASITNWFRVPLTLVSALALLVLHNPSHGKPGVSGLFVFCSVLMIVALLGSLLHNGVAKLKNRTIDSDSQTLNA